MFNSQQKKRKMSGNVFKMLTCKLKQSKLKKKEMFFLLNLQHGDKSKTFESMFAFYFHMYMKTLYAR